METQFAIASVFADKVRHKGVLRRIEQFAWRGHLRQLAARFKYCDQVAELHGFINIVSDHNDGFAHLFLNTQKLFLQLFADYRVDRAERFVHQHKLRVCRQSAGNAHALLLASGKLPGEAFGDLRIQTDDLQ
ncbi:Uncharacterised protein [Klebsiella pneumoniae]|nr:Uncharacterised protein [Klebsiella pneumoniae]